MLRSDIGTISPPLVSEERRWRAGRGERAEEYLAPLLAKTTYGEWDSVEYGIMAQDKHSSPLSKNNHHSKCFVTTAHPQPTQLVPKHCFWLLYLLEILGTGPFKKVTLHKTDCNFLAVPRQLYV